MKSSSGAVLAVIEKAAHSLSFFDAQTGECEASLPLPLYPHEIVADAQGRYAFIGHYGVRRSVDEGAGGAAVIAVDLRDRVVVDVIETVPHRRIHGVGVDAHDRFYALSEADGTLLTFIPTGEGWAAASAVGTGGRKTHLFAINSAGTAAYITGLDSGTVSKVDPHDPSVAPHVYEVGARIEGVAISTSAQVVYVGDRAGRRILAFDADDMSVLRTRRIEGDPLRVYPFADGVIVCDITQNRLLMLDERLNDVAHVQLLGAPAGVSFHPLSPIAYVSLLLGDRVAVVDLRERRVMYQFDTRSEPDASVLVLPHRDGKAG